MKNIKEEWKDVEGFEGEYQVSNLGRVRHIFTKILTPHPNRKHYPYMQVGFKNHKFYTVHRLVANAFLENPQNLPEVNHKDFNTSNNSVDNLEWCDKKYNMEYSRKRGKYSKLMRIEQYDLDGHFIKSWDNIVDCERETGIAHQSIYLVCKGQRKTAGGYKWKKITETDLKSETNT